MFTSTEDLTQAREEAIRTSNAILSTAFEGSRRLAELNVRTMRQAFEQNGHLMRSLFNAAGPGAVPDGLANAAGKAVRFDESAAVEYVKQLFMITNETFTAIQSIVDGQVTAQHKRLSESFDAMASSAPAGTGNVISLMRQGVANVNATYAQASNQRRQLADLVEANVVGATKAATSSRKRAA